MIASALKIGPYAVEEKCWSGSSKSFASIFVIAIAVVVNLAN